MPQMGTAPVLCSRKESHAAHIRSQTIGEHLDHGRYPDVAVSTADPMLITSGPLLCRLHVWTEEEWAALPWPSVQRRLRHALGLGWVGAIPITCLN